MNSPGYEAIVKVYWPRAWKVRVSTPLFVPNGDVSLDRAYFFVCVEQSFKREACCN